ncbi:BTAD domain-containing putative transcriptional regulator [Streptomyces sp. 4N509B]|uniref:BTAD domain-containing putative transcriptional regulator n=1 Tax=Streptomyces sp. 4N509B TaxID=3457413 RepID=UPI003FD5BA22
MRPVVTAITTFGELSVRCGGREPVDLGGPKPRLVLALLLSRANGVFPTDGLIDAVWAGRPPRTARKNLQVHVCRLRRVLGERLVHTQGGYRLRLGARECDLVRFEELVREGRRLAREGRADAARALLDEAVALWRGRPLAEFGRLPCLTEAVDRLEEVFLGALEEWAELEQARGGHRLVRDRLQDHAVAHPLRERLAAAWMRSLVAGGGNGEAMAHFETVRLALARELGVAPGPVLTSLWRGLLHPGGEPREERRGDGDGDGGRGGPGARLGGSHPDGHGTGSGTETGAESASGRAGAGQGGSAGGNGGGAGNQLPRDLPDFVGRTAEVHHALSHLGAGGTPAAGPTDRAARGGVLVVSGAVGVGKTAFAVHVAHLLADAHPDGLLLAELGNRPLGTVLRGLLDAVGLPAERNVARSLARWRSWVAGRRLLLVLDDAVSASVAEALLPGCGRSSALVTSRYRLSGLTGVARVQLPPLGEEEGTELLGRVIGLGRLLADPPAVARIVRHCDGLPLALRIAGAKLDALRHLRPAEYADRLRDAPSLLDEMAAGELVLRERYEAFWRDLPAAQRAAYRRLAAATPPLRYEQVAADAEELLECSLLTPPAGEVSAHLATYGMSAFAREFARESASAGGASDGSPRVRGGVAALSPAHGSTHEPTGGAGEAVARGRERRDAGHRAFTVT